MIGLENAKKRCSDCAVLAEADGKWVCNESEKTVEEVERCPEGVPNE